VGNYDPRQFEEEGTSLREYINLLIQYIVPITLITFAGLAVAIVYALTARDIYQSTTSLKIQKPSGNILDAPLLPEFSDFGNDRIVFLAFDCKDEGKFLRSVGADPYNPVKISGPMGLNYDPIGNLWLADSENSRVVRMDNPITTGTVSVILNSDGKREMIHPVDVVINSRGDVAVLDDILREIIIFKADYFNKAKKYYKNREFAKAEFYLKKAIRDSEKVKNDNIYALFYLGQCYEMTDRLEEAYKIYKGIVEDFSYGVIRNDAKYRMNLLKPLIDTGKL